MIVSRRRFRQDIQIYTIGGDLGARAIVLLISPRKVRKLTYK